MTPGMAGCQVGHPQLLSSNFLGTGTAQVNAKGHRYYRRSKRVGGRVVSEHVGRGELANLDAEYDAHVRELDRVNQISRRVAPCRMTEGIALRTARPEWFGGRPRAGWPERAAGGRPARRR